MQELLLEQDLVDILVDIVPRGEAHARRISGSDYQKLEVLAISLFCFQAAC